MLSFPLDFRVNMYVGCRFCQLRLLTTIVEWPPIYISLEICLVYYTIPIRFSTDYISSIARSHNITNNKLGLKIVFFKEKYLILDL